MGNLRFRVKSVLKVTQQGSDSGPCALHRLFLLLTLCGLTEKGSKSAIVINISRCLETGKKYLETGKEKRDDRKKGRLKKK